MRILVHVAAAALGWTFADAKLLEKSGGPPRCSLDQLWFLSCSTGPIRQWYTRYLLAVGFIFVWLIVGCTGAGAQVATFTQSNIGTATGSYNFSGGTYSVAGSGSGVSGTADNFSFANTPVTGNIEIEGKVQSITGSSTSYSVAGLMIRDSLNANGATALVSVSPANGVNFTARTTDGAAATTTLGPSLSPAIYLRLVVTGVGTGNTQTVAGYQSSDGISWQLVGKATMTMPNPYYAGFAVASTTTSQCTGSFSPVYVLTSVPQRSSSLLMWLRSDVGVQYSGASVSGWLDQSGNGFNASQTNSSNQPTLNTSDSQANNLPSLGFNGSSSYLSLPNAGLNLTTGCSIFIVANPTTLSTDKRLIEFATSTSNQALVYEDSTKPSFYVENAGTAEQLIGTNALSTGAYQIVEAIQNGSGNANLYATGMSNGSGTVNLWTTATPTSSLIGSSLAGHSTTFNFNGNIAEILVYSGAVSAGTRQSIEQYLIGKYSLGGSPPMLAAPTLTPQYAVAATTQTVTITPPPGAVAYYSINSGANTLYTGTFTITTTQTVRGAASISAYAVQPGFQTSPTIAGTIQIDSGASTVLQASPQLWLRADNGVTTSGGSNVTSWADISGNNNTATGAPGTQPTWLSEAINGLPAVSFTSASTQYLSLPAGFSSFNGATILAVLQPTTLSTGQHFIDLGNGGASNDIRFEENNSSGSLYFAIYNGTTNGDISSSSTLVAGTTGIATAVQNGSGTGTLFYNGAQVGSGSLNNPNSVSRSNNYIGRWAGSGSSTYCFNGEIAELIVFNTVLSPTQLEAIQGYLSTRWGLPAIPPLVTPSAGTYSSPQTVTMSAYPNAQIRYTVDGSVPNIGSTLYTGPFSVLTSTVVQAIAVANYQSSSVVTVPILINSMGIPTSGLSAWLRADYATSDGKTWFDWSGNGNTCTWLPSSYSPYPPSLVNGLPAILTNSFTTWQFAQTIKLSSGYSLFVVNVPTPETNNPATILDFVSGTPEIYLAIPGNSYTNQLYTYNSSTSNGSVQYTDTTKGGNTEVLEALQSASSATIYSEGVQAAQGALPNSTLSAATAYLGSRANYNNGSYRGYIFEVLLYSRQVTASERAAIENYLLTRYRIPGAPATPMFSIPAGTSLTAPSQVQISAQPGQVIRATTNGSIPTTSTPPLTGPLQVNFTQTIQAISDSGYAQSPVSSATYTLDPTKWPAPSTSTTAPKLNLQVPTPAQ
jgi:Chitobiase/beta-hexosaminidase C-terminal domain/Concanavalin A-like lectin/glucanases superfamily/Fn3 associated